ncbi:hypothetical protein AB0C29_00090 [Actinoplanes sp. NPDC048791]|uniref:hypothetical protein n=1 Tax=Actinoplanes sp. NPDC048791 TaxID=3154623 RepID=UPI00340D7391
MQSWAQSQQRAGRPHIQLTKTTISEVLAGRRLPSIEFLVAFLEVCGIANGAQGPWLAARAKVAEQGFDRARAVEPISLVSRQEEGEPASEHVGELTARATAGNGSADHPPAREASPQRKRRRPTLWIAFSIALAFLAVIATVWVQLGRGSEVDTTLTCLSQGCMAENKELAVRGRLTGQMPSGHEVQLLIRVESTKRWYLAPPVVPSPDDDTWAVHFAIGNPDPQPRDRHFTICAYLMLSSSIEEFSKRQEYYAGDGVPAAELAPERKELECIPALRRANT